MACQEVSMQGYHEPYFDNHIWLIWFKHLFPILTNGVVLRLLFIYCVGCQLWPQTFWSHMIPTFQISKILNFQSILQLDLKMILGPSMWILTSLTHAGSLNASINTSILVPSLLLNASRHKTMTYIDWSIAMNTFQN